jgi:hypothetical protein
VLAGDIRSLVLALPGTALDDQLLEDLGMPTVEDLVAESCAGCSILEDAAQAANSPDKKAAGTTGGDDKDAPSTGEWCLAQERPIVAL